MKTPASPEERAALVGLVSASAKLIALIGAAIGNPNRFHDLGKGDTNILDETSAEFVDAIIEISKVW